jgi:geranylgeranyl diphosphate synthase type II
MTKFEEYLEQEVLEAAKDGPTELKDAMVYAVFPGGGRVRPRFALETIKAMGYNPTDVALGAAMSVELAHCASLVHDDLPCFDNADTRRGKPSIHRRFGESTALLVGDALIVSAFDVLVKRCMHQPQVMGPMVQTLARAIGASSGIIAGQASETDPAIHTDVVHRKKTGALFEAAAGMAALSVGRETTDWCRIGRKLGRAYQLADDILDVMGDAVYGGKPVSQDIRNRKPNAVIEESLAASVVLLDDTIESAVRAIPPCPGRDSLARLLIGVATRLVPHSVIPRDSGLMNSADMARFQSVVSLKAVG